MDYAVVTKGTTRTLASPQPSREEAAEFWCELIPEAELAHVLDLMNDAEHKPAIGGCFYLVVEDSAYPYVVWGEKVGELLGHVVIPAEEHRCEAITDA
jgi:hypothetical protein